MTVSLVIKPGKASGSASTKFLCRKTAMDESLDYLIAVVLDLPRQRQAVHVSAVHATRPTRA